MDVFEPRQIYTIQFVLREMGFFFPEEIVRIIAYHLKTPMKINEYLKCLKKRGYRGRVSSLNTVHSAISHNFSLLKSYAFETTRHAIWHVNHRGNICTVYNNSTQPNYILDQLVSFSPNGLEFHTVNGGWNRPRWVSVLIRSSSQEEYRKLWEFSFKNETGKLWNFLGDKFDTRIIDWSYNRCITIDS